MLLSPLDGTNTRASEIRGYFPQMLKYQDIWIISSTLKELYWISEARWDILKFELWFIIGGLNFPFRALVLLVLESDGACASLNSHSARKNTVLVLQWWYKPKVIKSKICEGTDCLNATLSSGMTCLQVMVTSARSVGWGKNGAVTFLYLIPYPRSHMYIMQTQGSEIFLINTTAHSPHWHSR